MLQCWGKILILLSENCFFQLCRLWDQRSVVGLYSVLCNSMHIKQTMLKGAYQSQEAANNQFLLQVLFDFFSNFPSRESCTVHVGSQAEEEGPKSSGPCLL